MQQQEWEKIKEVFTAALEQPIAVRAQFLAEACGADEMVRREVESLLGANEEPKNLLEKHSFDLAAQLQIDGQSYEGKRFGPYRILREIGRGGMGAVFLAERADGEFQQQVALKIIRQSFADGELEKHFRRERQILASLSHPHIAKLLDGGVSDTGELFLAMEFIEGESLIHFAENHRLTLEERLQLFLKVCRAVSFAHQSLIIHRDLKPSNVLVTEDGAPKLLDFGLAKVFDAGLEFVSTQTETVTAFRAFTPAYAAPEQILGKSVTTTSDVFSLGVILYELLTNEKPFHFEGKSLEEIIKTVTVGEPSLPSRVVNPENPQSATRQRQLKGDLDNITLKAVQKDPPRRYQSVAEFADDIERHLGHLPISARPNTVAYQASRFYQRNKIAVSATALIIIALVAGLAIALRQYSYALRETAKARSEAAKSDRINAFLQNMLSYADPSWYSPGRDRRGDVKVIEVVNEAAGRLETELADQPEVRAELHHTIGNTYRALGRLDLAEHHFQSALELSRAVYGEQHPQVARDLYYLAATRLMKNDYTSSERLYRQAIAMMRATDAGNVNLPHMLNDLGGNLIGKGDAAAAEPFLLEALELFRQRYGDNHFTRVSSLLTLGQMYEHLGQRDKADATFQESIARVRRLSDQQALSYAIWVLGQTHFGRGEYARAEPLLREALDIDRQLLGEDNFITKRARDSLADLYRAWGKPELAARSSQTSSTPTSSRRVARGDAR